MGDEKAVKGMKLDSWLRITIGWLRTGEFILGNAKGEVILFHGRLK